jgi:hypothetical protein
MLRCCDAKGVYTARIFKRERFFGNDAPDLKTFSVVRLTGITMQSFASCQTSFVLLFVWVAVGVSSELCTVNNRTILMSFIR